MLPPARANLQSSGTRAGQIIGAVLGHRFDQKGRLLAVLGRLEAACPVTPPISNDQFVDRIALWTRDLYEYAGSIDRRRMDRLGDQEIEIVQSLGVHAQGGQITDGLISEGRCEKLDQLATATLGPSPGPGLGQEPVGDQI